MAIAYSTIRREVALRSAQLSGTDQDSLETAYTTAIFADSLDGAEVPATSIKNQVISIEMELCHIIGSDASHPYRTFLYAKSADLANLDSTPAFDENGAPFIGVFDSCADSATDRPLTLMPTETLTDYENDFFSDTALWNYCIVGNTIQHTRPLAYLQGCSRATDDADADYDSDGESPLPQMLADVWISGVLANLGQVGWTDQASAVAMYGELYQQGIQMLRMGSSGMNLPLAAQANPVSG